MNISQKKLNEFDPTKHTVSDCIKFSESLKTPILSIVKEGYKNPKSENPYIDEVPELPNMVMSFAAYSFKVGQNYGYKK